MADFDIADTMDDIFNVGRAGDNIETIESEDESQEGAYSDVCSDNIDASFDEKANKLRDKIGEGNDVESIDVSASKPLEPVNVPDITKGDNNGSSQGDPETILSESIPTKTSSKQKSRQVDIFQEHKSDAPERQGDEEDHIEIRPERDDADIPEQEEKIESKFEDDDHGFFLHCSSDKFASFYKAKKITLERLLVGGRLQIGSMKNELSKVKIDCRNVEIHDYDRISSTLSDIRQWRDRVIEIRSQFLFQYFHFKRFAPMLEGQLARCFYDKPAARQAGVKFEHMHDIELYTSSLEAINELSQDVLKNLDAKYENISRLVTMSIPTKPLTGRFQSETYMNENPSSNEKKEDKKSADLSGFDKLENDVESKVNTSEMPKNNVSKSESNSSFSWSDVD